MLLAFAPQALVALEAVLLTNRRDIDFTRSPSNRLTVLAMVRSGTIDTIDRQVERHGLTIESGFGQRGIARKKYSLITPDGAPAD